MISGEGAHFSAGLDLSGTPGPLAVRSAAALAVVASRLQQDPVRRPAGGVGAARRGGRRRAELATSTHVRVADRSTFYQLPEGQRGIFVGGGASVRVGKIIGPTA